MQNSSIHVREYKEGDAGKGLAECLSFFSPDMAAGEMLAHVLHCRQEMQHPVFVAVDGDEIVGTASAHVEFKLTHGGSAAGYIEDVAVRQDRRREGIGELLISHCLAYFRKLGCYKAVLDCDEHNVAFYEACTFYRNGVAMRADLG